MQRCLSRFAETWMGTSPSVDLVAGATLRGVYKAIPEKIWINTEDAHGLDGRVEMEVREM